jgi:hypothetical protein
MTGCDGAITSWCKPCKDRGRLSVARHEVNGTPMCDACLEGKRPRVWPKLAAEVFRSADAGKTKKEGNAMGSGRKGPDEATRAKILKDHADGMSVEAIRKRYDTGWITVKNIVAGKDGGGRRRSSAAPIRHRGRPPKSLVGGPPMKAVFVATPELCDLIWAALPLEKKAALLNRLHEVT